MEWELQQLTILEKELVTGSEREELGLPSVKSSSCPLTVLIRAAGEREKPAQKTEGREKGGGRGVKASAWGSPDMGGQGTEQIRSLSVPCGDPGSNISKASTSHSLAGGAIFLFFWIVYPVPSQAGQGWLQSRLDHVTCL